MGQGKWQLFLMGCDVFVKDHQHDEDESLLLYLVRINLCTVDTEETGYRWQDIFLTTKNSYLTRITSQNWSTASKALDNSAIKLDLV